MPNMNETEKIARKLLPIIYVLDTSGSMDGSRIAAVNNAMGETIEVLKELGEENADADMKIGVLQFSSGAEWVTKGLVYLDDFYWQDLTAGGVTDIGAALQELNTNLSKKAILSSPIGYKCPVIIFLSDGQPTDDYEKALMKINAENAWFRGAIKIGLAVDDEADVDVLATICGVYKPDTGKLIPNKEAVAVVHDLQTLKKLIRVVSATSAMISSRSRVDAGITGADALHQAENELDSDEKLDVETPASPTSSGASGVSSAEEPVMDPGDFPSIDEFS